MLEIVNLHAQIEDTKILKGYDLKVNKGEIHAIMGPNGSGKSTLAKVLAGDPSYEVTNGSVSFKGKNLLELEIEERALEGLFMAFQYPVEIPGVNNASFLRMAFNARRKHHALEEMDPFDFDDLIREKCRLINMPEDFIERNVNFGFSGGEKKRNEILQLAVLEPELAILDETDSGLDIDALRVVADGINKLRSQENAIILITHYQRLLDYIEPDFVHIQSNGRIVKSGNKELAKELEEKGYQMVQSHESIPSEVIAR